MVWWRGFDCQCQLCQVPSQSSKTSDFSSMKQDYFVAVLQFVPIC